MKIKHGAKVGLTPNDLWNVRVIHTVGNYFCVRRPTGELAHEKASAEKLASFYYPREDLKQ